MSPLDLPPLPPGTRIGGNVVEAVLGSGSYGTVYRVRGPDGHRAALKLLPLEEGSVRTGRAWRELSLGMCLHHPNLVRQLGAGQWPESEPRFLWLKFELIEGPTLEEWGQRPGRTPGEVVERVMEVARGLAVAHDARVVHRDVKEDNILVSDGTGQAVLVDFGAGYHEGDATLTKGMFPPGAPCYRAPEAWAFGRAHADVPGAHYRAGPGDDLYALGVVLYRLLTGRFPFRLTDEGGVDVEAVLHRVPLPPHLVNPRVPRDVEAVCLRLLEKRPEARYPSAVALYEALETLKAGADAAWRVPLHGERRAAGKRRRRRARVLVGTGVGLAVALGCWWLTSGQEVAPRGPAPEPARAVAAPAQAPPPAVAASPAAPRKDSAPVKQQQTSGPQGEARPRGRGAAVRTVCLGLAGAALQACLGAQQVPPVRPAPLPQPCPPGAVETMRTRGLRLGEMSSVEWGRIRGRSVLVREDTPIYVFGDWDTPTGQTALPGHTRLSGRLYFTEDRVYGRFTEARTPTGETYPVCLELLDTDDDVGLELRPGSEPGKVLVDPVAVVRVVDRFQ
ncbi:serine/threonine-protein kinase [Archangium sp.]|jgi:serine/threonine-protein kinase|uniref:serine/threonine-protein kinase n=1 Tax=Archangium sp. TaxID=1872627 RepID=UPI002EDBA466